MGEGFAFEGVTEQVVVGFVLDENFFEVFAKHVGGGAFVREESFYTAKIWIFEAGSLLHYGLECFQFFWTDFEADPEPAFLSGFDGPSFVDGGSHGDLLLIYIYDHSKIIIQLISSDSKDPILLASSTNYRAIFSRLAPSSLSFLRTKNEISLSFM